MFALSAPTPTFYLVAIPAVIILGLAKGGFYGVGTIATPMMALVLPPVTAAAVVMPILIVQDVVGVWAFRRTWDRHVVMLMIPTASIGVFLGWLLAAHVSEHVVQALLGALSILFAGQRLWVENRGGGVSPVRLPDWVGALCGIAAGFTSQIAHAGGPPYQVWAMPRRLPRDVMVGSTAIIFAVVNWVKVPAYVALGGFSKPNMTLAATLLPLAIISTFAGVKLVRVVPAERFYTVIYVLMIGVGLKLLWDGLI